MSIKITAKTAKSTAKTSIRQRSAALLKAGRKIAAACLSLIIFISAFVLSGCFLFNSVTPTPTPVPTPTTSKAYLDGSVINYTAGADINYVNFLIKDSQGLSHEISKGQTVTPNENVQFELAKNSVYNGTYTIVVTDGKSQSTCTNDVLTAEWTRTGNEKNTVDAREDFSVGNISINDDYLNKGVLDVAALRDAHLFFNANAVPSKVTVTVSSPDSLFTTKTQTYYQSSGITASGEGYSINISSLLSGINNTEVNGTLTANTDSKTVKTSSATGVFTHTAPAHIVNQISLPSFTGSEIQDSFLNLKLSKEVKQDALFSLSYKKEDRVTGTTSNESFSGTVAEYFASIGQSVPAYIFYIPVPVDNQAYNYTNFSVSLTPDGQVYGGTAQQIKIPDLINHGTYAELELLVRQKIGSSLWGSGIGPEPIGGWSENADYMVNVLIDVSGKVRAQWHAYSLYGYSDFDMYGEFQIPGVTSSSNLTQWKKAVANMTVRGNDLDLTNFTEDGSLSLADAQTLFYFALDAKGSDANKSLLTGAKVVMMREAKTQSSSYYIKMYVSIDNKIYETSLTYGKGGVPTLYDLASYGSKYCAGFTLLSNAITLADTLFPAAQTTSLQM